MRRFLKFLATFLGEVIIGAFWCFVIIVIFVIGWFIVYVILIWLMR